MDKKAIAQNSNTTFFQGIYQEVWRKLIPPGLTEAECDFILDIGNLQPGAALLDLMCGYGRHALELARRGCAVTAIDSTAAYVQELQQKASAAGLPVQALQADVSELQFSGTYQAAICMGNSFSFFNEQQLGQLLKNLSAVLEKGGCLVINTWMLAEIVFRHFQEKAWQQVDEYRYLIDSRYCLQPSRIEADHIVVPPSGDAQVLQGVDYIFSIAELEQLLRQNGFALQEVFSTPRKRRFQLGDAKAYLVAVRQ